jgi:hypothetical protein
MKEILNSQLFGVMISLIAFEIGLFINPLIVEIFQHFSII